jgi:hypothetical protein
MLATEFDASVAALPPPPVVEASAVAETHATCPFRAVCKSAVCAGDWTAPECPGSRKEH